MLYNLFKEVFCMTLLISTGQLAQLFDLPKHTIRHYVDEKLLTPQINPENNYQQFDEQDVYKLYQIIFLRKIGLSIEKIKEVLKEDQILPALAESIVELEEKIRELQAIQQTVKRVVRAGDNSQLNQVGFMEKEERYLKELPKEIKVNDQIDMMKARELGFSHLELFYFLVDERGSDKVYVLSDPSDYDRVLGKGVYAYQDIELEDEAQLEQEIKAFSEDPLFEISRGTDIIFYENIYRSLGYAQKQIFTLEFQL